MFFLFYASEDGVRFATFERMDQLKKVMEEHGLDGFFATHKDFQNQIDNDTGRGLLIEGNVRLPKPKKVVSEWE